MFKAALVSAFCSTGAFAFQTAPSRKLSSAVMMADKSKSVPFLPQPPNLVGVVGERGFDPLGFSNWIDVRYLQEAEIKHCRVAMLGFLGFIATEFVKLPGDVHQVSSVAAHDAAVASGAMYQILIFVVVAEILNVIAIKEMLDGSGRKPGYFGFDPLGFAKKGGAEADTLQTKELENGRAAMLAFGGIVTQAVLFDKGFPYF